MWMGVPRADGDFLQVPSSSREGGVIALASVKPRCAMGASARDSVREARDCGKSQLVRHGFGEA